MSKELYIDDASNISVEVEKLIENKLKEFNIELSIEQQKKYILLSIIY